MPDAVGALVAWLTSHSGWTVEERGERVAIAPRHICLLFRRFQAFGEDSTRADVRALEDRRVPHVLVGGRSFHAREEVAGIRTALEAIERPDDKLSVYATLRGPLFSFSDAALLEFITRSGHLHPLRPTDTLPANLAEVAEGLELLARLHLGRQQRAVAATLSLLLDGTRAHAGIAIWPTGEQALANVLRLLDQARRFEARGATSFRAFLEFLEHQAVRGVGSEAPVIEEGTDGVRMMTVHAANGLEFPVVVLCDVGAPRVPYRPSRHIDQNTNTWATSLAGFVPQDLLDHAESVLEEDEAEIARLTYVTATRSRDLLVVPTVGDQRLESGELLEGWTDYLYRGLFPPRALRRRAAPAPGCPRFGDDSVRKRSVRCQAGAADSVQPGLHQIPGVAPVVWWDPRALSLDVEARGGLRQMELLRVDEARLSSEQGIEAHAAWSKQRAHILADGASSNQPVAQTVTHFSHSDGATFSPRTIEVASTDEGKTRGPRGARFGTLVHAVLAEIEFDALEAQIRSLTKAQGRLLAASEAEIDLATRAVLAALAHPEMQSARAAQARGECRRETPLTWRCGEGQLLEGIVDCAYRSEGTWTVIDFKTDLGDPTGADLRSYEIQVSAYCEAIERATGDGSRGLLLGV